MTSISRIKKSVRRLYNVVVRNKTADKIQLGIVPHKFLGSLADEPGGIITCLGVEGRFVGQQESQGTIPECNLSFENHLFAYKEHSHAM